jgi:hypothetical protein
MKAYANLNKFSKYFASQAQKKPFEVSLVDTPDEFCWYGNSNKYRTSDLDFFIKESGSEDVFFPHGLLASDFPLLHRCLHIFSEFINEESKSESLGDLDNLFNLNKSPQVLLIKQIIDSLPKSRPLCKKCDCDARYCEC